MSFKKTFLFFLVFAFIGSYYYLIEIKKAEKTKELAKEEKRVFSPVKKEEISEVTFKKENKITIRLVKENNAWRIKEPVEADIDEDSFDIWIDYVAKLPKERIIVNSAGNIAEFGLDNPSFSVNVKADDGSEMTLISGDEIPTGSMFYSKLKSKEPIYGSGLDYSRVLFEEEGKRDMINLGWSMTPNSSFDITYYKFSQKKKRKGVTSFWGLRGMFIPKGLNGGQSTRLGVLLGSYTGDKFGYEIGYFHDFASMPITKLFSSFDYADTTTWGTRFLDYPSVSDGGLPTEYSRLTGLSVRVSFNLSAKKEDKEKLPNP